MVGIKASKKLGRILKPDQDIYWMSTYTGPSFAKQVGETSLFDIYVTGRDSKNRSSIGIVRVDIEKPNKIIEITSDPIFTFGEKGAFDENGVSYPYLVNQENKVYMYYVGWMPTVITPFQNHTGLAAQQDNKSFVRVSKAPILERTNDEYLGTGSCSVLIENSIWKMWYTSFLKWGSSPGEHKHYYVIKYAESKDGIHWVRNNQICINYKDGSEYSIGKPSVVKIKDKYHMWYSYRGEQYRIGYAYSSDGINWVRKDDMAGVDVSKEGWDSKAVCYSHVFSYKSFFYMLYNGNDYGKEGLGLAKLEI
jgi:predicted GH43/DUF377 family glycosyl hydrolase